MVGRYTGYSKQLLEWWVSSVQRHPLMVMTIALLLTVGVLLYSATNIRINTDTTSLISDKLHFRKLQKDFQEAFPELTDTIVVVISADTMDTAVSARKRLARYLRKETDLFKTVYEPGGGSFFEKNGLLYLSTNELEDFADNMAAAQPLLALLSKDLSLRGLFSVVEKALQHPKEAGLKGGKIALLLDQMKIAFDNTVTNRPYRMSWQNIMLSEKASYRQRWQFIIIRPYLKSNDFTRGEVPLKAVRRIANELQLNDANGTKILITGDVALTYENLTEVRNSIGAATIASLLLVSLILYIGLKGSGRLIFAGLTTLIIGLIWTTGFAIAFIGSLNMISVTFAVLFIGLGIDYSIQFCLRHIELIECGSSCKDGIICTARGVGRALLLSCITTAIGFYSFLPTAYAGVGELGLISGTGMFISFFANLTVLPALLTLMPLQEKRSLQTSQVKALLMLPYKYPTAISIGAFVLGLGAATVLPKVYFDYNPLNLYNPKSEVIVTIKELFKDPEASPWTTSILARSAEDAKRLAESLGGLKEVKMVVTVFDFVPQDQTEKLGIISDIKLFMPPDLSRVRMKRLSYEENNQALNMLENALKKFLLSSREAEDSSVRRLYESIQKFKILIIDPTKGKRAFAALEDGLLTNLPALFGRLETLLQATAFDVSDLPRELAAQYMSIDRHYRVQVFPRENLMNRDALVRFVKAVRAIAPDATDSPVSIYESGMAVISSFRQATLYALVAIVAFLLIELRSFYVTALILIPLVLAMLLTAAASVFLSIPLNFANVIVVPLLLGVGVHTGIIFIIRYQTEPPPNGNMLTTSTARAVLFSSLTTMISTGSLSFSSHRGIASMGILLTVCFGFLIISTLFLLPALIQFCERCAKGMKRDE
jgi:hopanoid biosynthesis associated RND transporter like protein HpnN